jgi:hypothetical protein
MNLLLAYVLLLTHGLFPQGVGGKAGFGGKAGLGGGPSVGCTQIASDTFARASLGANWTQTTGSNITLGIYSSTAIGVTAGTGNYGAVYWSGAGSFTANQYSKKTISQVGAATTDGQIGPAVLISSSANTYYWLFEFSGNVYISKQLAGVETNITGGNAYVPAVNDVVELYVTVSGSTATLTAYVNGVSIASGADSTSAITTGVPGIAGYDYTSTPPFWEATPWKGGNATAAGPC